MMQMVMQRDSGTSISTPFEKCPLFPKGILPATVRVHLFTPAAGELFLAEVQNHPTVGAQAVAHYRMSCDRSRLKRGPPSHSCLFLS